MSIFQWENSIKAVAYGFLNLKPAELDDLTILEFEDMFDAFQEARLSRLWESAYWTANIMSMHSRKPIKAESLMQPFLPHNAQDKAAEGEAFFRDFYQQRKEAENGKG